jgi:hypothetical protein
LQTLIGIALALPLGFWIGYKWRDRISQQRRARYLDEHFEREQRAATDRGTEAVRAVSDQSTG